MFTGKFRWVVLGWLFIIYMLAYFDRVNFSMAAPILMKEMALSSTQLGLVMSGFTIGYTMLNFPAGFIAARFPARSIFTVTILLWSVMTVFTGMAWGFLSLMIVRIIFGMCEGPLTPCNTKLVNAWALPNEKATASGAWLAGIPVGVVVGNIVSGYIITTFGWRMVFYSFGIGGLIFALITWKLLRDHPEEHPSLSAEELKLIQESNSQSVGSKGAGQTTGSTVGQMLSNPWTWVISFVYMAIAFNFWGNLNWLPTYFVKARGSSLLNSGYLASLPWLSGLLGLFILGWLSDNVGNRYRATWLAFSLFIIAPVVAYAVVTPSLTICLALFCIALFFTMGALAIVYALCMDIFPKADAPKAAGIMLGWGSFSGIIAPTLIGVVLDLTQEFNYAYYCFGILALLGCFASLALFSKEKSMRQQQV